MDDYIIVSSFPAPLETNPYQRLLYNHLKRDKISLYPLKIFSFDGLLRARGRVDIIHIHWLFDQVQSPFRLTSYLLRLLEAKLCGYGIVWTVHNICSHDHRGVYDSIAHWTTAKLADALIVHGETVKKEINKRFSREKDVWVIPHGHFIGVYPGNPTKRQAREKLKLPKDAFIALCFGLIREYKGVKPLISAFSQMPEPNIHLVIAGKPVSPKLKREIDGAAEKDKRIHAHLEYIADDDVATYFSCADVVVLPYQDITTSGVLMLALSMGKPVISVDKGVIPEVLDETCGIVISSHEELAAALRSMRKQDLTKMECGARRRAESYDWQSIAYNHRRVFERVLLKRLSK